MEKKPWIGRVQVVGHVTVRTGDLDHISHQAG